MKSLNKRGSHVGVMISFSIFVIFLISTFMMISPALEENGEKNSILNLLQQEILKNVSSNMTLTLLMVEESYDSGGKTCLTFSEGGWKSGENIVVLNKTGIRINSTFSDTNLNVNWVEENNFLKIYSSPEDFVEKDLESSDCASPEENDFSIKSIKTQEYIFESKIVELGQEYLSSYNELKEYFGIPNEKEFGFSFTNSQGITYIDVGKEPSGTSVYSMNVPIIYLTNQSYFASGIIKLKTW
jgi:hypothetical protein